ncbi:MAG: hypothetical protein R2788_15000 [Saprospiraceae bacterium]
MNCSQAHQWRSLQRTSKDVHELVDLMNMLDLNGNWILDTVTFTSSVSIPLQPRPADYSPNSLQ